MAKTVFTGWRKVTPGRCLLCGFDKYWICDGRGNILCECQACVECGELSADNFHAGNCPTLVVDDEEDNENP